jgi:hypothetical protein
MAHAMFRDGTNFFIAQKENVRVTLTFIKKQE